MKKEETRKEGNGMERMRRKLKGREGKRREDDERTLRDDNSTMIKTV